MLEEILLYTVLGFLGGTAHVFVDSETWDELKKFSSFKSIIIGGIIGFLYYYLHSDYNFPNNIMAFVSAYAGQDFIKALTKKYKSIQ
jgi:hypothetical protein